jgi:glutathione S-transferase
MLLYHDPRAPNPRRVRVFLAEKNVAYDTIEVLIADSAHHTEAFRRKNPLSLLPVLELPDGRILRESMAICRFIEEQTPEPNLFGATDWERASSPPWHRPG